MNSISGSNFMNFFRRDKQNDIPVKNDYWHNGIRQLDAVNPLIFTRENGSVTYDGDRYSVKEYDEKGKLINEYNLDEYPENKIEDDFKKANPTYWSKGLINPDARKYFTASINTTRSLDEINWNSRKKKLEEAGFTRIKGPGNVRYTKENSDGSKTVCDLREETATTYINDKEVEKTVLREYFSKLNSEKNDSDT